MDVRFTVKHTVLNSGIHVLQDNLSCGHYLILLRSSNTTLIIKINSCCIFCDYRLLKESVKYEVSISKDDPKLCLHALRCVLEQNGVRAAKLYSEVRMHFRSAEASNCTSSFPQVTNLKPRDTKAMKSYKKPVSTAKNTKEHFLPSRMVNWVQFQVFQDIRWTRKVSPGLDIQQLGASPMSTLSQLQPWNCHWLDMLAEMLRMGITCLWQPVKTLFAK